MMPNVQRMPVSYTHLDVYKRQALMTAKEKEMFGVTRNEALMNRIRMGSSEDIPIEYTYSRYVANGYELVIDLK